jgi:hypothetical protein
LQSLHTLQGLARADALAALLLAAEDGSCVEDALMRAATCMDLGGCAKLWREQHGPPPEVVDLQDDAAAEDAARQAQQERERQVRGVCGLGPLKQLCCCCWGCVMRVESAAQRVQHGHGHGAYGIGFHPKLWREQHGPHPGVVDLQDDAAAADAARQAQQERERQCVV